MHIWGDGFDFDRLQDAGHFIAHRVFEKTGCRVCFKEKYGSLRWEVILPPKRVTDMADLLDRLPGGLYLGYRFICGPVTKKAWKVLLKECLRATTIYPDMKDEILQDIACDEMLVGKELHNKYWH